MPRGNLIWLLGVPAALACGLVFAYAAPRPDRDYERIRAIVDVLATVEQKYVNPLTDEQKQKLVEDMINGGLGELDRHSMYLNEDALNAFEVSTQGEYGGIGVLIGDIGNGKHLTVDSPLAGSPAYDAGIQPGDVILAVEGADTSTMTAPEARRKITGKPGTTITLTVRRVGRKDTEQLPVARAVIPTRAVTGYDRSKADPLAWDYLADKANGIALVRVAEFNGHTTKEIKAALEAADKAGAKAVILDLRDNPGGLLTESVDVSELFLPAGTIASTTGRDVTDRVFTAKDDGGAYEKAADRPMAVLVNRLSASAAEIVAAALQENGRAVVVGEPSYGKGSVQKVFDLPGGKSAVKITTEKWLTPKGRNIGRGLDPGNPRAGGVSPDAGCEVKLTDDQWAAYLRAVRQLTVIPGKPGVAPPPPTPPAVGLPAGYTDPVVEKAVEVLRKKLGVADRRPGRAVAA